MGWTYEGQLVGAPGATGAPGADGAAGPAGATGATGDSAFVALGDGTNGTAGHIYFATGATAPPFTGAAPAGWTDGGRVMGADGHGLYGVVAAAAPTAMPSGYKAGDVVVWMRPVT